MCTLQALQLPTNHQSPLFKPALTKLPQHMSKPAILGSHILNNSHLYKELLRNSVHHIQCCVRKAIRPALLHGAVCTRSSASIVGYATTQFLPCIPCMQHHTLHVHDTTTNIVAAHWAACIIQNGLRITAPCSLQHSECRIWSTAAEAKALHNQHPCGIN
jgi:hypothetical protein